MSSKRVFDSRQYNSSRLVNAISAAIDSVEIKAPEGQFKFKCTLQTPYAIINNFYSNVGEGFDMEFEIPFDDDLIANEAKFIVYNMNRETVNKFKEKKSIRCIAGYGDDTGVVFDGWISKVLTKYDGADKITTIYALDDVQYTANMMKEETYSAGTTASFILRELLERCGLYIKTWNIIRDHIFDDETKVMGSIVENIKKYAQICGVSVYVYQQQVHCRPIWDGDNLHFNVNANTGLIDSPELFIEENQYEEYIDTVHGYNVNMLFQKRINTAGIVNINSRNYAGTYRIISGTHEFDGVSATTNFKCIEAIYTTIDESKVGGRNSSSGKYQNIINSAVQWAVDIANDDSHQYSQRTRWGPHYDCSSFVISAYEQAGVPVKTNGATYTGDMKEAFLNCDFEDVTSQCNLDTGSGLKKGDVLLNETGKGSTGNGHATLVQNDGGTTVEARGVSYGIVSNVSYRNYPWDCVLRYTKNFADGGNYPKILLNPGHGKQRNGNTDPGASGCGYTEAELTRELVNLVADKLNGYAEVTVWDVEKDIFDYQPSLDYSSYDWCLSIHFDAGGGSGSMVIRHNSRSRSEFETTLLENVTSAGGFKKRSDSIQELRFTNNSPNNSTLFEVCFIDNQSDMEKYQANKNAVAQGIANAIISSFNCSYGGDGSKYSGDWISGWHATSYGCGGDDLPHEIGWSGQEYINYDKVSGNGVAIPIYCIKTSSAYNEEKIKKYFPEFAQGYGTIVEIRNSENGKTCTAIVNDCGGFGPEGTSAQADKKAALDLQPNTQKALGIWNTTINIEYRVIGHWDRDDTNGNGPYHA